jgi:threonine/homoserine/homoserine lactone efflux protein
VPIITVVLMLATPHGRVNGPAFLAGWIFGLAVAGTILLVAAGSAEASSSGAPEEWVSIVKIVLGLLLLLLAVRQWRGRPRADAEPELPAWMKTIDTFTPPKAAGMAVLLSAVTGPEYPAPDGRQTKRPSPTWFTQARAGSYLYVKERSKQ